VINGARGDRDEHVALFKPIEYAKAGIPHATLMAFSLVAGAYKQIAQGSGKIEVPEPFPVTVDLTTLISP
jgi:hypothetical protein